jgi:hypothetical protein
MTDSQHYGFAKLVPGFDFLQNLAKGTTETLPQMPNLSNWVAPTLDVEELEKRIQELRAVHFWLDQNSKALGATIQALEVQKMTLATLKGMNCSMADLAQAMRLTPQPGDAPAPESAAAKASGSGKSAKPAAASAPAAAVIDPLQWWGSLTQQFQHIAASAMQEATQAAQAAQAAAQAPSGRSRAGTARRPAPSAAATAAAPRKRRKSPPRTDGQA